MVLRSCASGAMGKLGEGAEADRCRLDSCQKVDFTMGPS